MILHEEIRAMESEAVRLRQALHQIPEIGFQLFKTQAIPFFDIASMVAGPCCV